MSQSNRWILSRASTRTWLTLLAGCVSASCAHAAPAPAVARNSTIQSTPQSPANEVSEIEVILREDRIEARAEVPAGGLTFSIHNATGRERTAEIQGKGGPWRVDRPIPPERSMTLEVMLEPGDYVLVSRAGETRLTAKFRALKPGPRP